LIYPKINLFLTFDLIVAFVTDSIWLSVATFMILKVAFHACHKSFELNSSFVTFFALIVFGVTDQMIIFIVLFVFLIIITCFATP